MDTITLTILNLITSQIEGFSFSEINSSVILNKLTEIQTSISSLSRRNPSRKRIFVVNRRSETRERDVDRGFDASGERCREEGGCVDGESVRDVGVGGGD